MRKSTLLVLAVLMLLPPVAAAESSAGYTPRIASNDAPHVKLAASYRRYEYQGRVEDVRLTWGAPDSNTSPESYIQVEMLVAGLAVVCDQRIGERCAGVSVGDHVAFSATIIPCDQCLRLLGQNLVLAHSIATIGD